MGTGTGRRTCSASGQPRAAPSPAGGSATASAFWLGLPPRGPAASAPAPFALEGIAVGSSSRPGLGPPFAATSLLQLHKAEERAASANAGQSTGILTQGCSELCPAPSGCSPSSAALAPFPGMSHPAACPCPLQGLCLRVTQAAGGGKVHTYIHMHTPFPALKPALWLSRGAAPH